MHKGCANTLAAMSQRGRANVPLQLSLCRSAKIDSFNPRSRVPLIGLARLQRALEGLPPSFDPIQKRSWATRKREPW